MRIDMKTTMVLDALTLAVWQSCVQSLAKGKPFMRHHESKGQLLEKAVAEPFFRYFKSEKFKKKIHKTR